MMKKQPALVKFGQHIRQLRRKRDWTQAEMAERAYLSSNYYGAVERGEKNISLVNLTTLAKAFHISLSELFDY